MSITSQARKYWQSAKDLDSLRMEDLAVGF
jgi:hypothetical protein